MSVIYITGMGIVWLTSIVARETGSKVDNSLRAYRRNSNLFTTAVGAGRKTQRTEEVSCGEFGIWQHCHIAGHSLPNSANMIRWSGWESPLLLWERFFQFRCPTDAVSERRQPYGGRRQSRRYRPSPGGFAVRLLPIASEPPIRCAKFPIT
jgi:hypothetical protein